MKRGLLASRDELSQLASRIERQPFDAFYDRLHRRCSLILESAPAGEAQWRALWHNGQWGAAIQAARTVQGRILDLVIAHHIDRNDAYRDRAIEELKNLISWSTWVDPCHPNLSADLCTAEAAVAAVIGLDWLWEDLSHADRLRIIHAVRDKAVTPYLQGVRDNAWWYTCCSNWNAVVNGGVGLAALALSDEYPDAEHAYREAMAGLKHFFEAFGGEGGWDEGTGYWGYAMRYILLMSEAAGRLDDDQHLLHQRGMEVTGLFPIYFTPNGHAASFGDAATVPLMGALYLLVKHFGLGEVAWWLDTYAFHNDVGTDGYSEAGLAILFRPEDPPAPTGGHLHPLKVYNEIGWAAVADNWPTPALYVAAKTGDLSASHSQHDMNCIQLQADGEMLLCDLGAPPYSLEYFSDSRGDFYEVQARGHNTLVVGQRDHAIDAQGSIIDALSDGAFRWVACDAGEACGPGVHFIRHIVMLLDDRGEVGRSVLVLDELDNPVAEQADLYWHTTGDIRLDKRGKRGVITGSRAKLHFSFASTPAGRFTTSTIKNHGHDLDHVLHAKFPKLSKGLFLTVFSRDRLLAAPAIKKDGNGIRVTAQGTVVKFKKRRHHLQLDSVQLA